MARGMLDAIGEIQTLFRDGSVGGLDDAELLERFVARHEATAEAAFRLLVERHGPRILRVCRAILGDPCAAQDATQATFLVLARKAHTIGKRELLSNWLYGVASRTALKARTSAVRRRRHELKAAGMNPEAFSEDPDRHDLAALLHEEINRLPEHHQAPVVLCDLEGLSYARAAGCIGVSEDVLRGRLARARRVLRTRLVRRGVALSAVLGASTSWTRTAPAELVETTIQAMLRTTTGGSGVVPASVRSLAESVMGEMMMTKLKTAFAYGCAFVILATGASVVAQQSRAPRTNVPAVAEPPEPATALRGAAQDESRPQPGRVVPDGIDEALARLVEGRIVASLPVNKDSMVLSYLPDWAHGQVDNIGVAENDGGARTLLDWQPIAEQDLRSRDRRFVLALYSRKTTTGPKPTSLLAFPITEEWTEWVSWQTRPDYEPEPAASYKFAPGDGWKVFDVTPVVLAATQSGARHNGMMLRFLSEDRSGAKHNWSGYAFVSREGAGEWESRRPVLLVVESPRK